MNQIALQQDFRMMICPTCGIAYCTPERFMTERQTEGGNWYCPNGHSLQFRETETSKLRKQIESKEFQLAQANNRAASLADSLKKTEAAKKRLAKRLESGVCPVPGCKRHFTNLQRHISTEHKGVAIEAPDQKQIEGPIQ